MSVFQHAIKYVLHDVLAQVRPARHVIKKLEQRSVMPLKQQTHLIKVAVLYTEHQCIIRERIQAGQVLIVYLMWKLRTRKKVTGKVEKNKIFYNLLKMSEIDC